MNTENSTTPITGSDKIGLSSTPSTPTHRPIPTGADTAHPAHRRPHLPSRGGPRKIADKRHLGHQGPRRPFPQKKEDDVVPPLDNDTIRIITLGGVEEVGKNMLAIEFRNDIIIVDMGFQFKEESTPGIDYILPNTKYLEDRKSKIRAVVITHGHLDHIGGIPYIMNRIGNPPIYTRNLTSIMIKKRQAEFPHLPNLDIRVVEKNEVVRLGELALRFFSVSHTVPDSMGLIIETPYGSIVTPGDYKLDHTDGVPTEEEEVEYAIFEKEKVLLLMTDSTNIENPGFSTPEKLVHKNLEEIIKNVKSRLIIATVSSQMERMIKIIEVAEKYGKKIVVEGRSMKTNIEIAIIAGLLKVKKDTIISSQDTGAIPPERIVILATGHQGEESSALMRMATKSHKFLRVNEKDTVLLSSSIIPGNEKTVSRLKDNLARQGARIIHYRTSDVYIHSSGHGNRGEIEWLHKKIKSKFFIPIHGSHYMLRLHGEMAETLGVAKKNIAIPDNGSIMEIRNKGTEMVKLEQKAPSGLVMVDGFSIGDVQEVVIRDRQMLAQDGMFVIVAIVNTTTGKLKKSPDIISRGFIYLRESQELLRSARLIIKNTIEEETVGMNPIDFDYLKGVVTDQLSKFLFQKTAKHPIVMPVLIGV